MELLITIIAFVLVVWGIYEHRFTKNTILACQLKSSAILSLAVLHFLF